MTGSRFPCPACWFAVIVLLGSLFGGCNAPESKPNDSAENQANENPSKQATSSPTAKEVNLIDADQQKYQQTLDKYQGKYVLVDFWGTHCIPCIQKLPKLAKLQEKYSESLVIITFGMEYLPEETRPRSLKILQDSGTGNLVNLYNTDEDWESRYLPGAATLPYQKLFDPQGKLITDFWNDPQGKHPSPDDIEAKLAELIEK